jgi:NAD(P)-dependent dehydrogenase (short-subunit alcohol dehydrogenase family)
MFNLFPSPSPGFINTRWLLQGWGEKKFNAAIKGVERNTPLQYATLPEDVAEVIVSLLEGSRVVTGGFSSVWNRRLSGRWADCQRSLLHPGEIIQTDAGYNLGKL